MTTSFIHTLYRSVLHKRLTMLGPEQLAAKALVFAPHQDDETLACGGTVYLKKQAGASVKMVFLTDGAHSHPGLIDSDELRKIRVSEAVTAASVLGVDEQDLTFLGFDDGKLLEAGEEAVRAVREIVQQQEPEQILLPFLGEPPADHRAAGHIVLQALEGLSLTPVLYEYPVWYWYQWPWVGLGQDRSQWLGFMKKMVKSGMGARPLILFQHGVDIRQALAVKRRALGCYRSQMEQFRPHPDWITLADVAEGRFLDCFLTDYEVFCCR